MGFKKIKPEIDKYLNNLQEQINLEQVLIYGSFAENKAKRDSDVDLLILSFDFNNMDEDERLRLLYRKSVGFPYNLHVYGLTPEEYKKASPLTTLGVIKKKAKIILRTH